MAKTFVIHDESVNTHGYWMKTDGCDLTQFEKNPIMLWEHNHSWGDARETKLPIGHWENIRIKGKQILADAVFDADDFSQMIAQKVENNTLRMASVGARVIETSVDAKYIKQGQRYETVLKWSLREASIVNIGANNNALAMSAVLYDNEDNILELSDVATSPLKELSTKPENMNKELLTALELSDAATPDEVATKVKAIIASNVQLSKDKEEQQGKLDAIAAAEKEAKLSAYKEELKLAAKDGRLDFDAEGKVEARWLKMFDVNPEDAMEMLTELPKRESAFKNKDLSEGGADGEVKLSAMDKRRLEIQEQNKK